MLLGLFPLDIVMGIWPQMLTGMQDFSFHALPDPISSRYGLVMALFFMLSFSMMFVHFSRARWWWKALVVAGDFALYYLAWRLGYVGTALGWFLPVAVITMVWMWVVVMVLDGGLGARISLTQD